MTPEEKHINFWNLVSTAHTGWVLHIAENGGYTRNAFLNDCIEITDRIKKICNLPMNKDQKIEQLSDLITELAFYSAIAACYLAE